MLQVTDEALRALLQGGETDRLERKERLAGDAPTTIRQAICAFANDLPDHRQPEVAVVGLCDDGTSSGVAVDDELLRQLADMRDDGNILPRPTMNVEKRTLAGTDVAVVIVAPADAPPVRYKGRVYIRTGPRRGIASQQDERILNERRRHRDLPFDLQAVPTATLADLDRRMFEEEYLPAAFAADVLAASDRSYEQRLAALRMILAADEPTPTLLGLLVLSTRPRDFAPGAYVQFLRIAGQELSDPIRDAEEVSGPLGQVIRRLDEKVRSHIETAVDFTSGPTHRLTPTYPVAAIDQIARNAIMHRAYEGTNTPIRVVWFDDRLEVFSPGGPYGIVTAQNFGTPGATDYRNPHLADAMKTLGYVQRFGVGIGTARNAMRDNGNPPIEWEINDRLVQATLTTRP